jgi:hypothetical protein
MNLELVSIGWHDSNKHVCVILVEEGTSLEDCYELYAERVWGYGGIPVGAMYYKIIARVPFCHEDAWRLGLEVNSIL